MSQRNGRDIGDTVLNYAEVKALALGDPLLKARVETANELSKMLTLQNRREELRLDILSQISELPTYIDKKKTEIENCIKDIEHYKANKIEYSWEELKQLGKTVIDGLKANDYETEEREIACYQGFKIILPAGMIKSNPFVYVERNGRYKLEYKITDIGIMIRLNNLLESLPKYLNELKDAKTRLESKLNGLKIELERQDNYGDKIIELKRKLTQLDYKLGVKKNV
jgi:DNA repair exonuclease SbcCD ATPase subunit